MPKDTKNIKEKVMLDKEDLKDVLATLLPSMVGMGQKGPLTREEVDQILFITIGMFFDEEIAEEIEDFAERIAWEIEELGSPMRH